MTLDFKKIKLAKPSIAKPVLLGAVAAMAIAVPSTAQAAPDSEVGIAKTVGTPVLNPDGSVVVTYTINVTNPNAFDVEDLQVIDDFNTILATSTATPTSVVVTSSDFTVDHTGLADTTLLAGTDTLAASASGTITAVFTLDNPNAETGPFFNTADAQANTVCTVGSATTQGISLQRWNATGTNNATVSINLNSTDSFGTTTNSRGFFARSDAPDNTGVVTGGGNLLAGSTLTPPASGTPEVFVGEGWISAPCGATTWEIRAVMGNAVGTYLLAVAADQEPTSADIITPNGNLGFQHDVALFGIGTPSTSTPVTVSLASPTGFYYQADNRGAGDILRIHERLDGGAWVDVPASRYWVEKPTGAEIGDRAVADTSDNGTDPDPTSTNGAGTTDDPTQVTLPTPNPSLDMIKEADDDSFVTVGQIVTYTYTVTNNGDVNIRGVTVGDVHNGSGPAPTPANEALETDNGTTGDSTDSTANDGVWDVLAPGDIVTFTGTYIVTQADIDNLQ